MLKMIFLLQIPLLLNKPIPHKKELRNENFNYIILHADEGNGYSGTRSSLIKKRNGYHYYIQRNGTIIKMIDPRYKASHAGVSYYKGKIRMNNYSIGIAFENNEKQLYTEKQYVSAAWLISELQDRYPDSTSRIILGHSDIALPRGRKHDPGKNFDWKKLQSLLRK